MVPWPAVDSIKSSVLPFSIIAACIAFIILQHATWGKKETSAFLYTALFCSVLLVNTSENQVTDKALIEGEAFYGLGYNKNTDKIYVLKSLSYSGAGAVSVYKTDGSIVYSDVTTGIIPRQVIFF